MAIFIGIDLGTSGCRAIAIDENSQIQAEAYTDLAAPHRNGAAIEQSPEIWWQAATETLTQLNQKITVAEVQGICVDATSSTLLLVDKKGIPLSQALMYNDARAQSQALRIKAQAPTDSAAQGASSTLAKLLWLIEKGLIEEGFEEGRKEEDRIAAGCLSANCRPCHQADWIAGRLSGVYHVSDVNNCLKLGYDPVNKQWPQWLEKFDIDPALLPKVVSPGTPTGTLKPELCGTFGYPPDTQIIAGTTDSTAAFIASGACKIGEAVTCLGSTLVLKILSDKAIFAPEYGVYSQPLLDMWLVGGASNSGGAVLLKYFSKQQMQQLTQHLQPEKSTRLQYYPLLQAGERFPVNDPAMPPVLSPEAENEVEFFQALLEGIASIEKQGYDVLHELGAPRPVKIYTNGGGAVNQAWQQIRQNRLNIPVVTAKHLQAAYGTALIALRAFQ